MNKKNFPPCVISRLGPLTIRRVSIARKKLSITGMYLFHSRIEEEIEELGLYILNKVRGRRLRIHIQIQINIHIHIQIYTHIHIRTQNHRRNTYTQTHSHAYIPILIRK